MVLDTPALSQVGIGSVERRISTYAEIPVSPYGHLVNRGSTVT